MLTHKELLERLHYDPFTGQFTWLMDSCSRESGSLAGYKNPKGYIIVTVNNFGYRSHRLAWFYMKGIWPTHNIDHIDGDKSNNRFSNLRDVTQQHNTQNQRRVNGKVPGFHFNKTQNRWVIQLYINGKHKHLGSFIDKMECEKECLNLRRKHYDGNII